MRRSLLALAAAPLLLGGCYRITVNTGAPASPTVVDKPWVNFFVLGLVPPSDPINVGGQCPQGVSQIITEQSFLNGLVSAITYSLYTPQHVRVTCASGPVRTGSVEPKAKQDVASSAPAQAAPAGGGK